MIIQNMFRQTHSQNRWVTALNKVIGDMIGVDVLNIRAKTFSKNPDYLASYIGLIPIQEAERNIRLHKEKGYDTTPYVNILKMLLYAQQGKWIPENIDSLSDDILPIGFRD